MGLSCLFAQTQTPAQPAADLSLEQRGDLYMARKMYREAVETYGKGDATSAVIQNKIGIAYHNMNDMPKALKYYQRAVKLNSKYAEAVNNIGAVYYAQKRMGKAIVYYKRALTITPNSASIYSNLGTAYFARKKYEQASEAFQKALDLDPEVFEHRGGFGVMLQERGNVEERAKFHYYLAKTCAKQGMNERAILYIRKSLEEGFKERKKFLEEPEFAALKDIPEFQELMTREPRVL